MKTVIDFILDLDSVTERKEVENAIRKILDNSSEEVYISMTTPNSREQVRTFLTLDAETAAGLLKIGIIKIRWIQEELKDATSRSKKFKWEEV